MRNDRCRPRVWGQSVEYLYPAHTRLPGYVEEKISVLAAGKGIRHPELVIYRNGKRCKFGASRLSIFPSAASTTVGSVTYNDEDELASPPLSAISEDGSYTTLLDGRPGAATDDWARPDDYDGVEVVDLDSEEEANMVPAPDPPRCWPLSKRSAYRDTMPPVSPVLYPSELYQELDAIIGILYHIRDMVALEWTRQETIARGAAGGTTNSGGLVQPRIAA